MKMLNLRINYIRLLMLLQGSLFLYQPLSAQSSEEMKNIFTQAESYFIYEEYELANQLYLLIETPENQNIKYKIGTCYLNIQGEKEKSLPYLEQAVKSASFDAKTESLKETKAPPEVYFSLAKAYMINNEFEKALNTLQTFNRLAKEAGSKGQVENLGFIDQQIQACRNAMKFQVVPVSFTKEELGSEFSNGSINENPAVSFDGNTIVYTERRGIENAILFSKRERGKWQPPVEISSELKAGVDCSTSALNYDGTELFLYKIDNYDGAIYSSTYSDGVWSPIKILNKNINSKYYESHASISADGQRLYFTSNREDGYGNLDIYVSERDKSGNWGPAKNLGSEINTPFNEDAPFITESDSILFFCSEGHNSMGGFDNFKSYREESGWRTPSNLGYPVNSADDDKFFQPVNEGKNAYYSLTTGYKEREVFYLNLATPEGNLPYSISGKLLLSDTALASEQISTVKIINKVTGDTLIKEYASKEDGSYKLNVGAGLYRIYFNSKGFISQAVDTIIVQDSPLSAINLNVTLLKDTRPVEPEKPVVYEKIDLAKIPEVASISADMLIKNVKINDESDKNIVDSEVLYYTVQVIALHKPIDVTYFKYINDLKVMYNESDRFYRYTTGNFQTKEQAHERRTDLIRKGYPDQIFIKKISK